MTPSATLVKDTIDDLRAHAPFDVMEAAHLEVLAARLKLGYYAKGDVLLSPRDSVIEHLYIVQRGTIVGRRKGRDGEVDELTLSDGECFPVGSLIGRRATVLTFAAQEDSFVYLLPLDVFEHLMDISRPFREFAVHRMASLLSMSQRALQSRASQSVADTRDLARPVGTVLMRPPVTVPPDRKVRDVLITMHELRIGSMVIVDADGNPIGIFTERDVLDRIALGGISQDAPIEAAMTRNPFCLPASADVLEAAQVMARHRFRHVVVMDEGRLAGVISERDLFSLQRMSVGGSAKAIERAGDSEALAVAAQDVRRLTATLLAQGVGAAQLINLVTILNDAIVHRALTIAGRAKPIPGATWCWMGLGSEGRMEQTLSTDQDNAIIFEPGREDPEPLAAAFRDWALEANTILDACGFPLCKGQVMASNPRWCMSADGWRKEFDRWLRATTGEALLNAGIFFDFRALAGEPAPAHELRAWLGGAARQHPIFLRQMAINALAVKPPLGFVKDFIVDSGDFPGTIDLKQYGARPIIDVARVYALREGVAHTNTAERLRAVAPAIGMRDEEVLALIDAFHFIQLLRLRPHEGSEGSVKLPPNRIAPDALNELDRRILKEAFRQARKLQNRLEMDFAA
ncbi:MAG TPA: DUF294 nucleotidyltransferase-like domain-containing protein [Usitatibacteraceae bacterium]|nr:DUF294 nucleotidyltransferase-like domain-containing protein [Usitatibacteraceae bacterium]